MKERIIIEITDKILKGKNELDVSSKMVSPGFVDIHMHEDDIKEGRIIFEIFNNMVQMGVTTAVGGNCGLGNAEIGNYFDLLEEKNPPLNYAGMVGHGILREKAGCDDRYRKVKKN